MDDLNKVKVLIMKANDLAGELNEMIEAIEVLLGDEHDLLDYLDSFGVDVNNLEILGDNIIGGALGT